VNILVLSTYDLTPIRDGGQSRYCHLYRHIARGHDVTVVAYDQKRRTDRSYFLADRLRVLAARCGEDDRERFAALGARTGRYLHDVLCVRDYRFTPSFHAALDREAARADVVVASHPYLAPLAFGRCPARTIKVYEAHNVEYDAKATYFAGAAEPVLRARLDDTWQAERLACVEADYVTAVSAADADRLAALYGISRRKVAIVPNGADTLEYPALRQTEKAALRAALGIGDRPLAVFVGSGQAANIETYMRTRLMLAQAGYAGVVAVIGHCADQVPEAFELPFEERLLGFTDEPVKRALLCAADFALQLSFAGAGTTLKLFEYMAARSLVVANAFGRRGVPFDGWCWPAETVDDLRRLLAEAPWRKPKGRQIVKIARRLAEQHYDWRRIAAAYARLLECGRSGLDPAAVAAAPGVP
jgi:glycosyltransferase involved in cell wall biosynthesis